MSFEHITVARPADRVVLVTLNRPRQFNALARTTFLELERAFQEFESDSSADVLILTGSGRAFCFGADFAEFQDRSTLPGLLGLFHSLILKIHDCTKITIACLNGFATGAGLDLALGCDFRTASDRAKLGEAYIGMGLVCDGGGSYFLPRMIGESRALQMLLTGESVDAAEAKSIGLVHHVWPAEELQARTLELAQSLATKPQTALRLLKRLVRRNAGVDLRTALENERQAQLTCFEDPAHLELVREFLARRKKD